MSEKYFSNEKLPEVSQERMKLNEQTKRGIASLFNSYKTGQERISVMITHFNDIDILKYIENSEEMILKLQECVSIQNRVEFVEAVFNAMQPEIELRIKNPELFIFEEDEGRHIDINGLLSYELSGGDFINVHLLPDERSSEVMTKFNEGMSKLAEIVNKKKEIKLVKAGSAWIIKKHPKLVEKVGFTIVGENEAFMTREVLLEKYLKK